MLAVIRSMLAAWRAPRTRLLRQAHGVPDDAGLAIAVQAMAYADIDGASGVVHVRSRDPATGASGLVGTARMGARAMPVGALGDKLRDSLEQMMDALEHQTASVQTAEFIIEAGHLWLVDSRPTVLSVQAALKAAVDMVGEGLITREDAVLRIEPASLDQLLHPTLDPEAPASGSHMACRLAGAANGIIALDGAEAERYAAAGRDVILVRHETTPDDIRAMHAARASSPRAAA
nr:PEP/pyruvate-binding domain-containing protein [Hankyongella ginsenosidimutans]